MNTESVIKKFIPNILIVDDVPANLQVLGNILKNEGYKVRPVPNGLLAMQVAEKEKPDLILLDIMMPDIDGFEVCRRLKLNQNLKDVPVIFISALNDTKDIVTAFNCGGVDFITKPFQSEEISARVKTHLLLHQQSLKLLEQSKELVELNASKDKFFSIIAHDLRGPLGGFMGLSEMMADTSLSFTSDQKQDMILTLSQSARNIYNLLENLLEWSLMQHGKTVLKPDTFNLKELVLDCKKILSEISLTKAISLTVDIPDNHEIFADFNMISSVIRNLTSNALKFTPKGGKIDITAEFSENKTTIITIKDNGIGMSKDMVQNLFRIDVNSSRPGTEGEHSTGLGLHLCKEFVERNGGEIWVESEKGIGSSFCFTIPGNHVIENLKAGNKSVLFNENEDPIKNLKLLIAEDNENSEHLLRIVVSPFCRQVLEASTGTETINICRNNPDIDLVLMDINMPEMNGLEAARQIREFNTDIIIIAQTAFGTSGAKDKALAAGCNDYIAKPIDLQLLKEMIQKYFKR